MGERLRTWRIFDVDIVRSDASQFQHLVLISEEYPQSSDRLSKSILTLFYAWDKAQQNENTHSCRYCTKVFGSYQALEGHLRLHQNMMQNFPHFQSRSNSTDDTVPYFNSSLKGLNITSSGALMNNYCASGDNHRGNETELVLPSRLSHAPNYYASSSSVTLSGALMPTSLPLSRPIDSVNFNDPLGHAPYGGSTGSCQFDVEAVRGFIKRYPYISEHFLETMKEHNHSNHPVSCVICSVCPCYMMNNLLEHLGFFPRTRLDIKKLLGMERPVFTSLLLPPPLHSQFTVPMCPNKYIKAITSGRENKRCCLCRDLADEAMKRPVVSSISKVHRVGDHPPQKELLLFKDSDNSGSGSEIPTGGEEKCEDSLDLSLHL